MSKVTSDISVSLDGYVAGPQPTLEDPLGIQGMRLHDWIFGLASWRKRHGLEGGETNVDADVVDEAFGSAGAVIMGRRMFSGGEGAWEDDPNAEAWWGDDPPFGVPVFVLTHHARKPKPMPGGLDFTFVTEGIEAALERARAAAGAKNVSVAGGASAIQQYLRAGLLDELQIHLVPIFLHGGVRLFDNLGDAPAQLEQTRVIGSPSGVTHIRYRVGG